MIEKISGELFLIIVGVILIVVFLTKTKAFGESGFNVLLRFTQSSNKQIEQQLDELEISAKLFQMEVSSAFFIDPDDVDMVNNQYNKNPVSPGDVSSLFVTIKIDDKVGQPIQMLIFRYANGEWSQVTQTPVPFSEKTLVQQVLQTKSQDPNEIMIGIVVGSSTDVSALTRGMSAQNLFRGSQISTTISITARVYVVTIDITQVS